MRVLIHEQEFQGHYYKYLANIIPALAEIVDEVIVGLTSYGIESAEFRHHLRPFADQVDFQPILPRGRGALSLSDRFQLFKDVKSSVNHFRPDYLLMPSGDGPTTAMGLMNLVGQGQLPGRIPGEVGIHYGCGLKGIGSNKQLKDWLYATTQRLSSWKKIHYVSMTNYEWIFSQDWKDRGNRVGLMPDPIDLSPRFDKHESRCRLGIPEDGRYIGLAASIDHRKAIPEFLAAFRQAAESDDRMLLVGRVLPEYARLIEDQYGDLVRQERIIVRNGFFDQTTQDLVMGALDVVCTPYPKFCQLSAVMLQAIAAGKPVLVNNYGWMQAMVRRFGFGTTCDVLDPTSFSQGIRDSLDQASSYQESEATRRLLEFHSPKNFARTWLEGIRETMGKPPEPDLVNWSSVMEALKMESLKIESLTRTAEPRFAVAR